ncbi:MAG: lipoyl(octanoyl) transferase LipB [Actinomycetota bacterium]|nr:lipoyl(octanoyl) transferase LipB [Actinomycetota bacterium]MDA3026073.1 lipoyl(octanoyl) transferase LipB [Actinomycetota bacterium]
MTKTGLIIENWGSDVDYQSSWNRQREIHHKIVAENHADVAVLLEHREVFTAGRSTKPEDRPIDSSPVFDIDRGGRITWHGPGQIVCYPIMKLDDPVDVVAHVRRLELLIIDVCSQLGLNTTQIEGRSGVWVKGNNSPDKKIAAIGIRVAKRVTMHGFALNCNNSLDAFRKIVPCGIADADVTTLSLELGRDVSVNEVTSLIEDALRNGALKRNVSKRSKVEVS